MEERDGMVVCFYASKIKLVLFLHGKFWIKRWINFTSNQRVKNEFLKPIAQNRGILQPIRHPPGARITCTILIPQYCAL